jgi:aerobic C4-dicarboxylate transport protein
VVALIFDIDRFMSEARRLNSLIGNGVAVPAAAQWDRQLDVARYGRPAR